MIYKDKILGKLPSLFASFTDLRSLHGGKTDKSTAAVKTVYLARKRPFLTRAFAFCVRASVIIWTVPRLMWIPFKPIRLVSTPSFVDSLRHSSPIISHPWDQDPQSTCKCQAMIFVINLHVLTQLDLIHCGCDTFGIWIGTVNPGQHPTSNSSEDNIQDIQADNTMIIDFICFHMIPDDFIAFHRASPQISPGRIHSVFHRIACWFERPVKWIQVLKCKKMQKAYFIKTNYFDGTKLL